MTTKVSIKNYQSIKDVSFEIDGFTVILGKNNIGKSAIIRAIEAPLANQTGKSFIRNGEKKTTVKIVRDEIDIEWVKGTSATYTVDDRKKKEVFSKLNRGVPQPLLDAGFGKMGIGDKKVFPFIASQFDELFLVDKPGSVVTEVLASMYNIDVLSKADDMCQKIVKSQKSILKTREIDLKTLEEKLEVFKGFEKIKEEVAALAEKEEQTENLGSEISTLKEFEKQAERLTKSLKILGNITHVVIPHTKWFDNALKDIRQLREKEKRYQELTSNVQKLNGISKLEIPKTEEMETLVKEVSQFCEWDNTATELIGRIKQQKEVLENFNLKKVTVVVKKIEKMSKEYHHIVLLEKSFSENVSTTKTTRDELKNITEKLEQKEKEKAEIKVCPLCERPL